MLEARLNMECNEMAKDAVRESMTGELRHKTQELPLVNACVFLAGRKQQQIGTVQVKAYYISRETGKGGMDTNIFDTIAWNEVEAALEGTSKMFKMLYAKQGSGFCKVRYWTSKWIGN